LCRVVERIAIRSALLSERGLAQAAGDILAGKYAGKSSSDLGNGAIRASLKGSSKYETMFLTEFAKHGLLVRAIVDYSEIHL